MSLKSSFSIAVLFVLFSVVNAFSQESLTRIKEKSLQTKRFDSYLFEPINDSLYLSVKATSRRKISAAILNASLDTIYKKTFKKVCYEPQNLINILKLDKNQVGVYFYNNRITRFFQFKSKIHELRFNQSGKNITYQKFKLPGHIDQVKMEAFNGKPIVGGKLKRNAGLGVNLIRLSLPVLFDWRLIYESNMALKNPENAENAWLAKAVIKQPVELAIAEVFLLHTVIPFLPIRMEANFMAELTNGHALMINGSRLRHKDIKKSNLEDMMVRGDTLLLAFSNHKRNRPAFIIDEMNSKYRTISSTPGKNDNTLRPVNVAFTHQSSDTTHFTSVLLPRTGYRKSLRLLRDSYPRNYLNGKEAKDDVTKNDEEFENKAKKQARLDQKNRKKQEKLAKTAKTVDGVYFAEAGKSRKGPKPRITTKKTKGGDILPLGSNFSTKDMFTQEIVRFDTINNEPHRYTLRQVYYYKEKISAQNQNITFGSGVNLASTTGGTGSPLNGSVVVTNKTSSTPYLLLRNLSLRIDNLSTGNFSQFLIDQKYFEHELSINSNTVEKSLATLNIEDGKAYVSLIDKKKNLKTYRYTLNGGELIFQDRLKDITHVSWIRKVANAPLLLVGCPVRPFGYYDMDLNAGSNNRFIFSSYVKSVRDEDGKRLRGKKKHRFVLHQYQINSKAPKLDPSAKEKDADEGEAM